MTLPGPLGYWETVEINPAELTVALARDTISAVESPSDLSKQLEQGNDFVKPASATVDAELKAVAGNKFRDWFVPPIVVPVLLAILVLLTGQN
jgi:hypothetical protein